MIFENNNRIVFSGDSITDMGSTNPVGEGMGDSPGQSTPNKIGVTLMARAFLENADLIISISK